MFSLFATDHHGDGKAYETYGISKEVGAIVVVRPDQCDFYFPPLTSSTTRVADVTLFLFDTDVGLVVGLEDFDALDDYFGGFMIPARDGGYPGDQVDKVAPPDWSKVERQEVSHSRAVFATKTPPSATNGTLAAGGQAVEV